MAILVLDTTVLASYVLGDSSMRQESNRLLRLPYEFIAPDLWRAELANVFWKSVRAGHLTSEDALQMLPVVEGLVSITVSSMNLLSHALTLAIQADHPAYDCLFVALAVLEDTMLVSYDRRLASKFGERVALPAELLA